jgi:hypothetical protein
MKVLPCLALACAFLAPVALTSTAHAASPWDGTWKLDRSKSHLTGRSFTYTKLPSGLWHVSFGNLGYDFAPDGKPYPFLNNTIVTTAQGDHQLTFVTSIAGKVTETDKETLSADGKTITDETTGTRPDGTSYTDSEVAMRSGEGSGFFGKWVSTKEDSTAKGITVISTAPDGTITWAFPGARESVTGKFDGKPLPVVGPTIPPGATITESPESPTRYKYSVVLNGKVVAEGIQALPTPPGHPAKCPRRRWSITPNSSIRTTSA